MGNVDFTTWLVVGSDGGLTCSLLAALATAVYALRLRRGTGRQIARTMLVFLGAGCLMLVPIWWTQNRFDLLGPTLSPGEVAFWLTWAALIGWGVPLGAAAGYVMLAGKQPATGKVAIPAPLHAPHHLPAGVPFPVELSDPRRHVEPLGPGRAWGRLIPLEGPFALRPVLLTRQVTLLGRESDCDIVVVDQLTSRHHAELRWDRGRVALVDRGSMNGTRVNGQGIIGQAPLRSGDIVEIGEQRYRFEQVGSQPSLPAAQTSFAADEETHKLPGVGRVGPATVPATPALRLVVVNGMPPGTSWELNTGIIEIGRDSARTICLPDQSVSRLHAQIVRQAAGFYLHDLTSQNGTQVNGTYLKAPVRLQPGDVLRFGTVEVRCEALSSAVPLARPGSALDGAAATTGQRDQQAERATPPGLARAGGNVGWASRPPLNGHTRLSPQPQAQDRPHLGPPRLLPTDPPARET